ncbi:MAG: branched-chain amino acid ABC transporter permease [Nitrososphaerota archaeon]|nr:branched-chain amino acid ABC transporter permease [Nitrososphaerota archaeon]
MLKGYLLVHKKNFVRDVVPWVGALVVLAFAPYFVSASLRSFLLFLLMWIALSQSFNIFTGLTGYVNFGFVAFYGLGGYGMTMTLLSLNIPIYAAMVIGGVISSLFAFAISWPTLRLRGAYFAIAMLSLAQALFVIFDNWNFVNSATGYTIPVKYYDPVLQYYYMLAVAAVTVLCLYVIMNSRLGLALKAIKQNEETAVSIGINATFYKAVAFGISAFFAGLAGGAATWTITIIDPPSAFDTTITLTAISMSMLGGLGTIAGPIIGAVILYSIEHYFGLTLPYLHLIVFGIIIIMPTVYITFRLGDILVQQSMGGKND